MRRVLYKLLFLLALLAGFPAIAQSGEELKPIQKWPPPSTQITMSAKGDLRFTVTPGPQPYNSTADSLPPDLLVRYGDRIRSIGTLARREKNGEWQTVWQTQLVNRFAPVRALVAENGYVVTLDDWYRLGADRNTIAIYDPAGRLVRTMSLRQMVPDNYHRALPTSAGSSVHWYGAAQISEDSTQLLLDVLLPPYKEWQIGEMVPFTITLKDGAITPLSHDQWRAMLDMRDEALGSKAAETATFAERVESYRRKPLRIPVGSDPKDWHHYLTEAYLRLSPDWPDVSEPTILLLQGGRVGPDHAYRALTNALTENAGAERVFMIAGLCCANTAIFYEHPFSTIGGVFDELAPGSQAKITLYIVAGPELQAQLQPIIAPSGAQVIWLAPTRAIPQRPERIPGSAEEAAAQAEMEKRQAMELNEAPDEF